MQSRELGDDELRGVIVQATGAEAGSGTVKAILGSFKALKAFASFDESDAEDVETESADSDEHADEPDEEERSDRRSDLRFGLSYTINLNLPATSDIAVFDAIFKSLRANLLR